MNNLIYSIIISFIIFALYVQFSKTMGNVWIRNDINNNKILCFNNLFLLIYKSLIQEYFWSFDFLFINYWIYLIIIFIIINSFNYHYLN